MILLLSQCLLVQSGALYLFLLVSVFPQSRRRGQEEPSAMVGASKTEKGVSEKRDPQYGTLRRILTVG